MDMNSRAELEAALAVATAARGKACLALGVLNKVSADRRKTPAGTAGSWRKTNAELRKATMDRRKAKTDRRTANATLAKAIDTEWRAKIYRRKVDAHVAAREKTFADWLTANIAVERALMALANLRSSNLRALNWF
jgi:hypothetical protein